MFKKILAYMMVFLMLITLVPSKIYAEEVNKIERLVQTIDKKEEEND